MDILKYKYTVLAIIALALSIAVGRYNYHGMEHPTLTLDIVSYVLFGAAALTSILAYRK